MEKTVQGWDSRSCPIIRFEKEFNPCNPHFYIRSEKEFNPFYLHFYIRSWKEFNPFTFISMLRDKPKNLTHAHSTFILGRILRDKLKNLKNLTHATSTFILGSILRDKPRQRLSRLEKRKSKKP